MGFEVGKKKIRQHIVRERNPQVIKRQRNALKQSTEGYFARSVLLIFKRIMEKLERTLSKVIIPSLSQNYRKAKRQKLRI